MKKITIFLFAFTLIIATIGTTLTAETYVEKVRKGVPSSWLSTNKTASELGITTFNQSPMLDEKVNSGELPPVEQRLPDDPMVIDPYDQIGEYGGTWMTYTSLDTNLVEKVRTMRTNFASLFRVDPLGRKLKPDFAKGWEYNEDATAITIHLRKGLKWSDGHPLTAEDFMYYWEYELNNEDLSPVPPQDFKPVGWKEVEKIDDYTVKVHFMKPYPTATRSIGGNRLTEFITWTPHPKHYLKQFHPDFIGMEEAKKMAKDAGFDAWYQFYQHVVDGTEHDKYPIPNVLPWIIKNQTANSILLERNPYYPHVDSEGNQLPYVDQRRVVKVENIEIKKAKLFTGETYFGWARLTDLPMLKGREEDSNFKIGEYWTDVRGIYSFMPNMTHPNPAVREVIQNLKFRKALSMSIDRGEINETLFFGQAQPSANTIARSSEYYEPGYQKFIEFNPTEAKKLLDEIGLVDANGDGWRDLPSGEPFQLTMEGIAHETFGEKIRQIKEMVETYWQDVGLNINFKTVGWSLWSQRANNNAFDITAWSYDRPLGINFPGLGATAFVPSQVFPYFGAQWTGWAQWYETNGNQGMEPPEQIKQLLEWYEEMLQTTDEERRIELGKKILRVNADQVWSIGTITNAKTVPLMNENFMNIPKYYFQTNSFQHSFYPETWYFKGGEPAK